MDPPAISPKKLFLVQKDP